LYLFFQPLGSTRPGLVGRDNGRRVYYCEHCLILADRDYAAC